MVSLTVFSKAMKRICLPVLLTAVLLSGSPAPASAQGTAYDALRAVGSQRGTQVYNQLVSITGRDAAPQPLAWQLLFRDPSVPGGFREITVQQGRIVADTPAPRPPGGRGAAAMDLKRLNLNSDGAFRIVEIEARNNKIGFDAVNYLLRAHEVTGQPVWILDLLNTRRQRVSTAMVSAETGRTLRPPVRGTQHTIPGPDPVPQRPQPVAQGPGNPSGGFIERFGRTMDKTARSIEQQLVGFGDFITGKDRRRR